MKRAFALIVMIITTTMAFAQGTIAIGNSATELVQQWTSWPDTTLIPTPVGQAKVQFFAAPAGTSLTKFLPNYSTLAAFLAVNPGWNAYSITGIGPVAGRFVGSTVTVSPLAPGGNIEYFIIGWTGTFATLDAALAGGAFIGESPMLTSTTGNPTTTPPGVPTSMNATFTGLFLGPGCLGPYCYFTAQPTSQTVIVGGAATFYVGAVACPAPNYQWYFNGESIQGANGSSFQISNAQLTNSGTYFVVLSNPEWGVQVSASAILTVLAPPEITTPPRTQTACVGSSVYLRASAAGSPPLGYQWFFNGSAIADAGSAVLQLASVSATQAGAYTVVVSNLVGAVTSAPALLSVIQPVERRAVPGLVLRGQPGSVLNLEDADALAPSTAWATFDSVVLTNTAQWYFDNATPLPPQRFYRARQPGGVSVMPTLDPKMVPALSLTGLVGGTVRVDYINQFGLTDAWVALDTVTLSSTSQLYFDVTAPGQPPRLYRLVQVP